MNTGIDLQAGIDLPIGVEMHSGIDINAETPRSGLKIRGWMPIRRRMGDQRGRTLYDGWMSPLARTLMLSIGWMLVIASLGAALVGFVMGLPVLSLVGALTGFTAWTVASMMPEPLPAPRKAVRQRMDTINRLAGHHLPT